MQLKEVHTLIPFDKLYEITGSQFQPFNTIYQLFADKMAGKLNAATHLLMIPDYLNYKLTGISLNEYTNASTTGMLDIKTNKVSSYIVEKLGFAQNYLVCYLNQGLLSDHFLLVLQRK